MFYLVLLLWWLPQVPGAAAQPVTDEPPAEPVVAPTYDEGPLQVELLAMREIRLRSTDPDLAARMRPELGMQFRIRGERLTQVVRQGNVIFTELVDDTGQVLLDEDTYTEADRTGTRPMMMPAERLRGEGLIVLARNKLSARGALKLKRMRGAIRLILADATEKVTIENPLQYYGKRIADPRLEALGVEVQIVSVEELEIEPPANRCIALWYVTKGDNIQRASFYDGAMRPIPARDSPALRKSGELCQLYYFDATPFNDEMQLVLEIHPQIDDVSLPIEMDDVELP
jgi:hypothetical protein